MFIKINGKEVSQETVERLSDRKMVYISVNGLVCSRREDAIGVNNDFLKDYSSYGGNGTIPYSAKKEG